MKNVYAFDVDGTLTEPRQHIHPDFECFFREFVETHSVYLVTGSGYSKISKQLPNSITDQCRGVFTCSGAEFWQGVKVVYRKTHTFPDRMIALIEHFIDTSPYPERSGTHIEPRPGMLNVSVVGRDATLKQRKEYHEWDNQRLERKAFVTFLLKEFPQYEASIGGEISIDIVPNGWTKAVAKKEIEKRERDCTITFFGNRMGVDGNDKPLADELLKFPQHKAIAVYNFQDTWQLLQQLSVPSAV